jgi:hypothetical protein
MGNRRRRWGRSQIVVIILVILVAMALVVPLALGPPPAPPAGQAPDDPSSTRAVATPDPGDPEAPDVAAGDEPDDYLVIDRDDLLDRPTSGDAWDRMAAAAQGEWPDANLRDRSSRALPYVLAAALVHARTGDSAARDRVVEALRSLHEGRPPRDLLALVRQLGGWVVAADLVGYREPEFVRWLHELRYQTVGGHPRWRTIFGTAGETANNYGTFALASLIAADRFLGDERGLARDWEIFKGYGEPFGWPFEKTADWDVTYSCLGSDRERPHILPIAINPAGCDRWGGDLDGMPVEDAARSDDFPESHAGYVNEAMQGYAFQALLLARAGYDAWGVNDEQVRRVAEFQLRWDIWNVHPTGYFVGWIVNGAYGTDYPALQPTWQGRIFAWTEWLYP